MDTLKKLLETHRLNTNIIKTKKITFLGVGNEDVYNISRPFVLNGKTYLPGRVEPRDKEISRVIFFEKISEDTFKATKYQIPHFQDPCVTKIDGDLLIGGTEIFTDENHNITNWHTTFYKGPNLESLKKVLIAPYKMKDVRLLQDENGIHIFSRPQGGEALFGKIGYAFASKFSDITTKIIEEAPLLKDQGDYTTWSGVNDAIMLKNGWIGVLGHIAMMSEGMVRHYYGMTFALNPKTKEKTPIKIICERSDFAPGDAKRSDLVDVVFVGGIIRNEGGFASLYVGLSDAEAHYALINDPFLEYERLPKV
jgi:hypothetical protein